MLKYDLETIKKCANNLMFDMTDEQYDVLVKEFETIIKEMELLDEIEGVNDISPITFPFDVATSYLREDEAMECFDKEDVLKNAKEVLDGQIKLPKVVG